jgi:hypothetical protein
LVPTLFDGSETAAYEPALRATNNATNDVTFANVTRLRNIWSSLLEGQVAAD